jgi:two-component system, chemotaxis family, chemotaxis protein CheY
MQFTAMEPPTTATAPPMAPTTPGGVKTKKPLRILYAEDMRELRDLTRIALTMEGHAIECVEDGLVALEKIAADPSAIDVLITDHHMPKMNGVQLVTQVRELAFTGKIMIFSSELSREVNAAYRRLAVDKIIFKPVFPATLRQVLEEIDFARAAK